jgi:hypothetical protein
MTQVETVPIESLTPDPQNANKHTQKGMTLVNNSIRRRGLFRGIAAAGKGTESPVVYAGNLTLEQAVEAGITEAVIVHTTGNQLVVTVRDDVAPGSAEAIALGLEDNESGKQSYNPDIDIVAALAVGDNALLKAMRDGDKVFDGMLNSMGAKEETQDAEPQIDENQTLKLDYLIGLQEKWETSIGQKWRAGNHAVFCGDSTNEKFIAWVLENSDAKKSALIYDPDWDVITEFDAAAWNAIIAYTDGFRFRDVVEKFGLPAWVFAWDGCTSWFTPNRPLRRAKFAVWFGDVEQYNFNGSHYGDAGEEREVKNTRGAYIFKPDPRGKHLSDVFQKPLPQLHSEGFHPYEKPIDWARMLIGDCFSKFESVFDPFAGCGNTLIACEQIHKKSILIDIEPMYIAYILEQSSELFGIKPELESRWE